MGGEVGDAFHDAALYVRLLLQAGAGGEEGGEGMGGADAADVVLRGLLQADEGADGHLFVAVAGSLAAPGGAVDDD